MTVCGVFY